jgi:hypothetical protein
MKHYAKILSVLLAIVLVCTMIPSVSLAATARNASITSNSLPSSTVAKTKYTVTITVKNTGTQNWTYSGGYKLVPSSGNPFTGSSVSLKEGETIKPGKTRIFKFTITAPATAATYSASWQMAKGTAAFGAKFTKKITVKPLAVNSIYLLRLPAKLTYYRFEKLNIAGLAVMGVYNNGTKKQLAVSAANVTGYNSNYTGTYRLTVNVSGKKDSFSVTIWRMTLSSVKMSKPPQKLTYKVGEKLDFTGMSVSGTYTNGKAKPLSPESAAVSGFNNTKIATGQIVTLSFAGKTVKFKVNIIANDVMNARTAAHTAISTEFGKYIRTDYSTDGWTTLKNARTDGDAAIDAATTVAKVNSAKAAAIKAMGDVLNLAEEAQALATAKTNAHTALNTALNGYHQADYNPANWTALNKAKTDGDAAIDAATTVANVNSAKTAAINAMKAVKLADVEDLENAKDAAHVALDTLLSSYIRAAYSPANWEIVLEAKSDGDDAIDAADTISKVNTARDNALKAMDDVMTLVDEDLEDYRDEAHDALNDMLSHYSSSSYSTTNWTALNKAKTDGDKAIDAATSYSGVDSAKASAIAAMAAIKTRSQEAQELAAAKTAAHTALANELKKYAVADYSAANWLALNSAKATGDTAIDAATTPAGVDTAKTNAITAMANVRTLAEDVQDLLDAKAAAHTALATAFVGYQAANYSTANWTVLAKAKADGDIAIEAATTPSAATSAKNAAISAMAAVKTLAVELAEAKTSAHALLNSFLAIYHRTDYSDANWAALMQAKSSGDTAIEAATTVDQVDDAVSAAVIAMDNVKTLSEP